MAKREGKKATAMDFLPWIVIGLALLVILLIFSGVLKDKGVSLIEKIKSLFRS